MTDPVGSVEDAIFNRRKLRSLPLEANPGGIALAGQAKPKGRGMRMWNMRFHFTSQAKEKKDRVSRPRSPSREAFPIHAA